MFKNFNAYFLGKLVSASINFLLTPIFAVLFTAIDFGKVGIISTLFPIISIILGVGTTVSYALMFYKISYDERIILKKTIIIFTSILFLISTFILIISHNIIESRLELGLSEVDYLKILAIGYLMFLCGFILEYYRMNEEAIKYNILLITNSVLLLTITLALVSYIEASIEWYVNGYFIAYIIFIMILIVYERISLPQTIMRYHFDYKSLKYCINLGMPVVVAMLFGFLLNYADRYILKDITSSFAKVGYYTLGYKLGEIINGFILAPFLMSINPALFKAFNTNIDEYINKLNIFLRYLIGISIIYLIFMNVGLDLIFNYMFKDYYEAKSIIEIVSISYIIFGVGQIIGNIITVNEKIKVTMIFSVIASVLNISLNYLWIPRFGIVGAALSTLLAYFLVFACFVLYSNRLMKIRLNAIRHIIFITFASLFIWIIKLIQFDGVWIEMFARLLVAIIYLVIIYKIKYFPEMNEIVDRRFRSNDSL